MTHSKLTTRVALTSDSDSRGGVKIDRFIIHHAATTSLAAILSLFQPGGREVSANYALKDRELVATVDETRRAWTSGSQYWDSRAVTIEVANSTAGNHWPVSNASFDTLARLIADVAARYGFPIDDTHVLTHQELYTRYGASYATACPGDLQRRKPELLTLAKKYAASTLPATATAVATATKTSTTATPASSKAGSMPTTAQWRTIQTWLKRLGRYTGPVDGIPGPNTWKGIQTTVKKYGYYTGPVDGIPGINTYKGIQSYARYGGGYGGPIDGIPGPNTWAGFIHRLTS